MFKTPTIDSQLIIFGLLIVLLIVDYLVFGSYLLKKLKEVLEIAKLHSDNCYITLLVTVASSFALSYFLREQLFFSAIKTFIAYLILRFGFESYNQVKKIIFFLLYVVSLGNALLYNFNITIEMFCFLLGCSLLKSEKKDGYRFIEVYLIFFTLYVTLTFWNCQDPVDFPHSIADVLKSSTSYSVEQDTKSSTVKELSKDESLTKTAILLGIASGFLSVQKVSQMLALIFLRLEL